MTASDRFRSIFRDDLFSGQVALVTGGGTGIGRCIAHELAALGAKVVLSGRREEPLAQTAEEIQAAGGEADTLPMNIREETQVSEAIKTLVKRHGGLDLLVNNAGGQFAAPAVAIRPKGWRAVVDTNLNGTFFVSQAAFTHAMSSKGGAIVNIVADVWNGFPGMAHTGAARAGVINLTQTLAQEWAFSGTRMNAVAPGYILSSGMLNYPPQVQQLAVQQMPKNPSGRLGTESEVSAAVAFLLSPAATFINGATLRVDGGASFNKPLMLPVPPTAPDKHPPFDGFHLTAELPDIFKPFAPKPKGEG